MTTQSRSIAVIGAGFTGTLMAVHLLLLTTGRERIYLFEKSPPFGKGIAYGTDSPSHLLNVPASDMSAFEEEPLDFVVWLNGMASGDISPLRRPVPPEAFVPRRLYRRYLQHCLHEALPKARRGRRFCPVTDEVVDLTHTGEGVLVHVRDGRRIAVDCAVLTIGNLPPDRSMLPHYVGDPWGEAATRNLDPAAEVLIMGTGLTMVDTVLSLADRGHSGRIHAISRRGLLPQVHPAEVRPLLWRLETPVAATCRDLLRMVRAEVARAAAHGRPWQDVIHALRSQIQSLWQYLPDVERQRFLRHLRPWWDVHRHRVPLETAARVERLMRAGQLRVLAGRVEERHTHESGVEVRIRRRGATVPETLDVARMINCSGPGTDYAACKLVRNLVARGDARSDPHNLGLDVDEDCAVLDRFGRPSEQLFAAGPLTRGTFWEITAVPEIRRQCAAVARRLRLHPALAPTTPYEVRV